MIKIKARYFIPMFIITLGILISSCDSEPEMKQSELGIYSPGDLRLLGYEAEQCTAMALEGIKKTGRPYPNIGEEYSDAWVGDTLFLAPGGNVSGYGVSFSKNRHPGVKLQLRISSLPELKLRKRHEKPSPAIDELPRTLNIEISCIPGERFVKIIQERANLTIDDVIYKNHDREKTQYPPPVNYSDIGLIEYSLQPENPYQWGYYFPLDDGIKSPDGTLFVIKCIGRRTDAKPSADNICIFSYPYKEYISVEYRFPYQRLSEWQRIHEFVTDLVKNMEQEI